MQIRHDNDVTVI